MTKVFLGGTRNIKGWCEEMKEYLDYYELDYFDPMIDDSNKRPEKTVFVLLESEADITFSENQLQSLLAVKRLVECNGVQVFDNLKNAAKYMSENK